MGTSDKGREDLVLEASSRTALRKDNWLMIPPYNGPAVAEKVNVELGNSSDFQLYNLDEDLGQQNNLAKINSEQLEVMLDQYESIVGEFNSEVEQLELK